MKSDLFKCIREALHAGRKLDAIRLYREATGASLADAKALIDQFECGEINASETVISNAPPKSLTDYGWLVEPTDDGGVRLRRSALWRGAMIGCSAMVGLFFSPILIGIWWKRERIFTVASGGGAWQVFTLMIPLVFVGVVGLFFAALLWQMLRIALWREEWVAGRNRLIVRRGLLGFLRSREFSRGEFLLEPHHDGESRGKSWRLAVVCDGEKHYLIRQPDIRVGFQSQRDSHDEAAAVANLLAEHNGWTVSRSAIAIEGGWKPPSESNEEELLAALRSHRFVAELDELMRLSISPPRFLRRIVGLVLLPMGVGWLWFATRIAVSFINDAQQKQLLVFDLFFWLLMIPFLMIGVGLCVLGIAVFFRRERWTVDRNLLLVRSRLFGWNPEEEFVNARWRLAKVRHGSLSGRHSYRYTIWELQLESASGRPCKVLYGQSDDDVPRLLGTLFAHRTGWPLIETET
jgi:hypothetical protein